MNFTGKVVIVTGASSGIGATVAEKLAFYNASLALVGRNKERLEAIADACEAHKGIRPLTITLDLTDEGSCEEVIKNTIDTYEKLDVLINCAGKLLISSFFDETTHSFDELYKINLRVPYKLMHAAMPHLLKTQGNVILLKAGNVCKPGFLGFSVINSAIDQLVKAAAIDTAGSGISVNALCVILVKTNILENLDCSIIDRDICYADLEKQCLVKAIEPGEVAKMIIFIASGTLPHINGTSIYVDDVSNFMM